MTQEMESLAEFLTGNRLAAASVPWSLLQREDLRVLRDWAGQTMPSDSQRRLMRALRRALRTLEPATDDIPTARRSLSLLRAAGPGRRGSGLGRRQARLLLEPFREDDSAPARRDSAAIALMLLAGLRRAELIALQRADYDDDDGLLQVRARRGGRRGVILEGSAREELTRWLSYRGAWSGPLFAAVSARGHVLQRGISASTVNRLLSRRASQAGCDGARPKDLRARFLVQLRSAALERPRCRYYQDEDGQPAWTLPSLAWP